jgi:hypothetical protein
VEGQRTPQCNRRRKRASPPLPSDELPWRHHAQKNHGQTKNRRNNESSAKVGEMGGAGIVCAGIAENAHTCCISGRTDSIDQLLGQGVRWHKNSRGFCCEVHTGLHPRNLGEFAFNACHA